MNKSNDDAKWLQKSLDGITTLKPQLEQTPTTPTAPAPAQQPAAQRPNTNPQQPEK
jgi:hypothetical protein